MNRIDWQSEAERRKDALIEHTRELLQIPSVLDERAARPGAPFGPEVDRALRYALDLCASFGMKVKNLDGYVGHAEFGEGDEIVGILCHVDVVPAGDGWSVPPFGAAIRDGKLFGRGAMDDKGPTMAAIYAAKIVKDLGLPLKRRVRLIIGADEESQWRCVAKYFAEEEMPVWGFAPDADFPLIHAEKGLCDFRIAMKRNRSAEGPVQLVRFFSGHRSNMVPESAEAVLRIREDGERERIRARFGQYLEETGRPGMSRIEGRELILSVEGLSAHGSTPEKGIHAGWLMARFLHTLSLDEQGGFFVKMLMERFVDDVYGEKLGIATTDPVLGKLTVNVGVIHYPGKEEEPWQLAVNIRYPGTTDNGTIRRILSGQLQAYDCDVALVSKVLTPHHVPKDHPLVQTLMAIYRQHTGDADSQPLAIGGATYARSLKAGVAFGALFPWREDVAHQKDEYIHLEDLVKVTAIYAQAIHALANL